MNNEKQKNRSLIETYLPEYTFNEYHEIVINSHIEKVYETAKDFDLSKSKMITVLFKIRGLPTKRMNLQSFITDMGFTNLEENYPNETLIGFWTRFKIAPIPGYEDFIRNSISPWIKVVWNFQFKKLDKNKTKLSTETRVLCVADITRFTFGAYWLMIKPFSGLIRTRMLRIIKAESESAPVKG